MKDHKEYQALINAAEQIRAIIADDVLMGMRDYIDVILEDALKECGVDQK